MEIGIFDNDTAIAISVWKVKVTLHIDLYLSVLWNNS